jgi:hypothetical protein
LIDVRSVARRTSRRVTSAHCAIASASRVIAYTYDGLLRLTATVETPGMAFSYS